MSFFANVVQFLAIVGMLAVPEARYVRKSGGLSTEGRRLPSSTSRALRGVPVLLQTDVVVNPESQESNHKPSRAEAAPRNESSLDYKRAHEHMLQENSTTLDKQDSSSSDLILIEVGREHTHGKTTKFLRLSAPLLGVAILMQSMTFFGLIACVWTRCLRPSTTKQASSPILAYVTSLKPCSKEELQRQLPEAPMDCALSRPWTSETAMRLEVRVEGIATEVCPGVLQAPLTQRTCVVYSSAVTQQTHDGMNPISVAFAQDSINFELSLLDDPNTRIEVRGEDVRLFSIEDGHCERTVAFDDAPEQWQVFAMGRRGDIAGFGGIAASATRFGTQPLHFQEYALLVGAQVTVVGELHRLPDGRLQLQPPALSAQLSAKRSEPWRTSWECANGKDEGDIFGHHDKVLISDRASLLSSRQDVFLGQLFL